MIRNRNQVLRSKLKGPLDERIDYALLQMAECPDVMEVIPDKIMLPHSKAPGIERRGAYQTVRGAVVEVEVLAKDGYRRIVKVVSDSMTGARNFALYLYNLQHPGSYIPTPD